jgi:hypothetical protein
MIGKFLNYDGRILQHVELAVDVVTMLSAAVTCINIVRNSIAQY